MIEWHCVAPRKEFKPRTRIAPKIEQSETQNEDLITTPELQAYFREHYNPDGIPDSTMRGVMTQYGVGYAQKGKIGSSGRMLPAYPRAQAFEAMQRKYGKTETDAPIPWEQSLLLPSESIQMPQSADSMLIQISEPNRKYLRSIEMAGGSPDAFINRLIDSYRL